MLTPLRKKKKKRKKKGKQTKNKSLRTKLRNWLFREVFCNSQEKRKKKLAYETSQEQIDSPSSSSTKLEKLLS